MPPTPYKDRPVRTFECPDCGQTHQNKTNNRRCPRCQHEHRKHPCAKCGAPCDARAGHCNHCAPDIHIRLKERGERTFHKPSGYWLVKVPVEDPMAAMRNGQGYVREHRLVMADYIGRPLTPDEDVHHRDHDRGNNDIGNLELMVKADHHALHAADRNRSRRKVVDLDRLRELHGQPGMRVPRMAAELGVGQGVVRQRMNELGLAPFPRGFPPK